MSTFGIHCPVCNGRGSLGEFKDKAFPIGKYNPPILIEGLSGTQCSICEDHTFDVDSENKYVNTYRVIKGFDRECISGEWITTWEKYMDALKGGNHRLTLNASTGKYMLGWDEDQTNKRLWKEGYSKQDLCTAFRLNLIKRYCP